VNDWQVNRMDAKMDQMLALLHQLTSANAPRQQQQQSASAQLCSGNQASSASRLQN